MMQYFKTKRPDYNLALIVFGLVIFGLVMIFSASSIISYEKFGRSDVYLIKQIISLAIGIVAWIIFQSIDYHFFRKIAGWLLLTTFILLILVFIPSLSQGSKGVYRWINIGGFAFQPSEMAKLTLILYLSAWFERIGKDIKSFIKSFLPFSVLMLALGILIIKQPDMGTLTVLICVSGAIYFLAGASITYLAFGGISLAAIFWLLIKIAPYRMARFTAFMNPEKDPLGITYHVRNALIAIGSGGLFGLGFGQSRQKHLFLPEAHTDSIFAIICEELGFLRASLIIFAFAFLAYRGYKIAKKAPDTFGRLVAAGITIWFAFQAFINIAGITGLLPFTGVPIPFVSYGGTSLVVSLAAVGILLNISKYSN